MIEDAIWDVLDKEARARPMDVETLIIGMTEYFKTDRSEIEDAIISLEEQGRVHGLIFDGKPAIAPRRDRA